MSERELICEALKLIHECLNNIRHGREEHNQFTIQELHEIIIELEDL